jgi:lipopolysaccharide export system protein LptC
MATEYKKPKKIKIFLLATIVIALGAIIGIYIGFRQASGPPPSIPESVEPDATLSIGKIHQTATREGRKEWSLEADSAHYLDKTSEMVLRDLRVTFFLEDKSEIILTADRGALKTDSNDITVSGHVVLENEEYKLLAETLNYAHDRRVLYSKDPVTITGASAILAGDSISFDLNSKKLILQGRVETNIDKDFAL